MRDEIRSQLRRQGFFLTGTLTGGGDTLDVNTNGRAHDRIDVPIHASDNNYLGLQNLYLSSQFGDLPSPAGTHPWEL